MQNYFPSLPFVQIIGWSKWHNKVEVGKDTGTSYNVAKILKLPWDSIPLKVLELIKCISLLLQTYPSEE